MATLLFDMDGTLTPARKSMSFEMATELCKLSFKHKIGIVTGSPLDYVDQQTAMLGEVFRSNPANFLIMPCNGTKLYKHTDHWKRSFVYDKNMKDVISEKAYSDLISKILMLTHEALNETTIDPTGTFIQYRGSMINWCPIGRDSTFEQREAFEKLDKREALRETLRKKLLDSIDIPVEVTLGGSTSLDIYPHGWDKTYALRHFDKDEDIYFVGDKCKAPGNDATIFDACAPRSFEVSSPKDTLKIIRETFTKI